MIDNLRAESLLNADRRFFRRTALALGLIVLLLAAAWGQLAASMLYQVQIMAALDPYTGQHGGRLPVVPAAMLWLAFLVVLLVMGAVSLPFAAPPVVLWQGLLRLLGREPERLWNTYVKVADQKAAIASAREIVPQLEIEQVWSGCTGDAQTGLRGSWLLLSKGHRTILQTPLEGFKFKPLKQRAEQQRADLSFVLHHEYYHLGTDEARLNRLMSALIMICAIFASVGGGMASMKGVSTLNTLLVAPLSAALFILLAYLLVRWLRQIEVFAELRADLYALFRTGRSARSETPTKGDQDRLLGRRYPPLVPWQAYIESAGRIGTNRSLLAWVAIAACAVLALAMHASLPMGAHPLGLNIVFAPAALLLLVVAYGAGRDLAVHVCGRGAGSVAFLAFLIVMPLILLLILRPVQAITLLELAFVVALGILAFGPALRMALGMTLRMALGMTLGDGAKARGEDDEERKKRALPAWKRFLIALHDVCRYGAALVGMLLVFSSVLMVFDKDANKVDFDVLGTSLWLGLIACFFLTFVFRKSQLALLGETIAALAAVACMAVIIGGGAVWLRLEGLTLDDAVQSLRLGEAMRTQTRDFAAKVMADPELRREAMNHTMMIAIPTLLVMAATYVGRAVAIQNLKHKPITA